MREGVAEAFLCPLCACAWAAAGSPPFCCECCCSEETEDVDCKTAWSDARRRICRQHAHFFKINLNFALPLRL